MRFVFFFFFSSRRRHTRFDCDWSSDVCSSDLTQPHLADGILDPLGAAVDASAQALARDEEEVLIDRHVALRRRTEVRGLEDGPARVRDVPDLIAVVVALDGVMTGEREVGVGGTGG